jgi:GT2 family glycosyltransferase
MSETLSQPAPAAASTAAAAIVGVVVIGRNEGERLKRCLASLTRHAVPIVYVDSGSTDGSVEHASSVGAVVEMLDRSGVFTAARARNAGYRRLRAEGMAPAYVQFVDGDCEIDAAWFDDALKALGDDAALAAVCGHLRERTPDASIYNRLADAEWRRPVGDVGHCGGIFMMRSSVFEAIGGFDPGIAAGEEPELCSRVRKAGHRVVRIDRPMATHDLAMTKFSQWWRRSVRGGYGALRLTLFGPPESRGSFRNQVRSVLVWTVAIPLAAAALGLALLLAGTGWWALLGLLAWPALLTAQVLKLTARAARHGRTGDAFAFGCFTMLWKYAALLGFVQCLADRRRERATGRGPREFHKAGA